MSNLLSSRTLKPGGTLEPRQRDCAHSFATLAVFAGVLLCTVLGTADVSQAGDSKSSGPTVPDGWTFSLPDGDSKQGEAVFMGMRCFTCHVSRARVPNAPTIAIGTGPFLGSSYAKLPKEYLAESIIRTHRVVAAAGYEPKKDIAGMGQYNYLMTVEELVDLVAYLKAGGQK